MCIVVFDLATAAVASPHQNKCNLAKSKSFGYYLETTIERKINHQRVATNVSLLEHWLTPEKKA
jgi:hypothetical protein